MATGNVIIISILIAGLAAVIILLLALLRRPSAGSDSDANALADLRAQLAHLTAQSGELQKTVATQMHETEGRLGVRLEKSMRDQNDRTNQSLTGMAEKLAVISEANAHISALSGQVNTLQNILSNKQARGSFGEVQLENLVRDALPDSAYSFQHTLGNAKRVDCYIKLPNPPGAICIDSKFPLESYRGLTDSPDEARVNVPAGPLKVMSKNISPILPSAISCRAKPQTVRSCFCPRNPSMQR